MSVEQIRKQFAENLRTAREKSGLSQEALAEACDLHRTEISLLERCKRSPRHRPELPRISPDWLTTPTRQATQRLSSNTRPLPPHARRRWEHIAKPLLSTPGPSALEQTSSRKRAQSSLRCEPMPA